MENGMEASTPIICLARTANGTRSDVSPDEIADAQFGFDGNLYLLSHLSAPKGKILKISLDQPRVSDAQTVVAESRVAIDSFLPIGNMLYTADQVGGPSQLRSFDTAGKPQGVVPILPISSVDQLVRSNDGAAAVP